MPYQCTYFSKLVRYLYAIIYDLTCGRRAFVFLKDYLLYYTLHIVYLHSAPLLIAVVCHYLSSSSAITFEQLPFHTLAQGK